MSKVQPKREGGNPGVSRPLLRRVLISLCGIALAAAPIAGQSKVLEAMNAELERSMAVLGEQEVPPYFLSYEITESQNVSVSGSFGALTGSGEGRERLLDIDLRVGNYDLDNTRPIRDSRSFSLFSTSFGPGAALPIENDYRELRRQIWLATDSAYKSALDALAEKRAALQNETRAEDVADFTAEEPFSLFDSSGPDLPPEQHSTTWSGICPDCSRRCPRSTSRRSLPPSGVDAPTTPTAKDPPSSAPIRWPRS